MYYFHVKQIRNLSLYSLRVLWMVFWFFLFLMKNKNKNRTKHFKSWSFLNIVGRCNRIISSEDQLLKFFILFLLIYQIMVLFWKLECHIYDWFIMLVTNFYWYVMLTKINIYWTSFHITYGGLMIVYLNFLLFY